MELSKIPTGWPIAQLIIVSPFSVTRAKAQAHFIILLVWKYWDGKREEKPGNRGREGERLTGNSGAKVRRQLRECDTENS